MINSVNALEFVKPKLLTMDKYSSTTTTKLLPPSSLTQSRTFATASGHQNVNTLDEKKSQILFTDEIKGQDRVKVQHLENHTQLQNNKCWNNFRTLYNISASSNVRDRDMFQESQIKDDKVILDVVNVENSTSTVTPLNIQNKSAFNLDLKNKYHNSIAIAGNNNYSSKIPETNNNCRVYCKQYTNCELPNKQPLKPLMSTEPGQTIINDLQHAEDRNNAFRHIESVHNYAKSKLFEGDDDYKTSPNDSRHSFLDDDDDDEDDDEEEDNDDDAEYDNDDEIDYEERLPDELDADYEDIFSKRRYQRFQKLSTSSHGALSNKTTIGSKGTINKLRKTLSQSIKVNKSHEYEEGHVDVDVETIETPTTPVLETNSFIANNGITEESGKPDHHARRPMNAFLIFCKRHRAIVKERYKNLENRAITKILGDWWASLEEHDKKCFTNLAQQNKDAFFSANPNFKWYKLPAPPLRSLTTRPTNSSGQENPDDNNANNALEMISNISRNDSNYFKLADEAQMGDLSQLMKDKSKTSKQTVDLQQVLGETSQFLSAHITGNSQTPEENLLKRRFYTENSFSSNSSEEDIIEPKKKSARSCKGKIYQELINSGQIATALKKSKTSTRQVSGEGGANSEINVKQSSTNFSDLNNVANNTCQKRFFSESENVMSYDLNGFDLEEKIKELPALDLDDYLQRKRNTKKKKKFSSSGKKRGQRSSTNNNSNRNNNVTNTSDNHNLNVKNNESSLTSQYNHVSKHNLQTATAVGSQKRKARKESITRRDVSAIEQEVASLLPLTINGCCYFQEAPVAIKNKNAVEIDTETHAATSQSSKVTSISSIIPFTQNSTSSSVSVDVLNHINVSNNTANDNMSSSTSDLLILAEVAANHTELEH